MRNFLSVFLILIVNIKSFSQVVSSQLIDPVTSHVFDIGRYAEINGSPFYKTDWMKGSVLVAAGRYDHLLLKIDLFKNELLFSKNDQDYVFIDPFKGVVLMPKPEDSSSYLYFIKGLTGPSLAPDQFVQFLVQGKARLYRSDFKMVAEMNEINKGMVKYFNTSVRYYIQIGEKGENRLVRPNKKEVIEAIGDKMELLEKYCSENGLTLKKEKELIELLNYYNSL